MNMQNKELEKFNIQDREYEFPYHYIPTYCQGGFNPSRILWWGGEYLAYMKFVIDQIVSHEAKSVIDVGCGDGRLCSIINQTGSFDKIKGVDLSDHAIMWAKCFNPQMDFECKDVSEESETYDAVTAVEVIEHIPDDALTPFFKSISKVMKDDGHFYITVPSINIVPVPSKHYRHYTKELLAKQIDDADCGLVVEESYYIVPSLSKKMDFYRRLALNSKICLPFVNKWIWKNYWKEGLHASDTNGSHVFAIVRKNK